MLWQRLTFGPLFIVLLFVALWLDEVVDRAVLPEAIQSLIGRETMPPGTVTFMLCAPLSVLGARELTRLLRAKGLPASKRVLGLAAMVGLVASGLVPDDAGGVRAMAAVGFASVAVMAGSIAFYGRKQSLEGVVAGAGGAVLAFVYLGLMFGFILAIRREHSVWVLLWVLGTTKACDIGAFFTGRAVGKHKLISWLSPGKTWEGLYGGVATSAVVGGLGAWGLRTLEVGDAGPWWAGALMGAIFGLVGQAGDLMASALKRDAGAKDSGGSLPGFGGVLDVLDSPLLVAPVAYWALVGVGLWL
ncbi:MAG: phosphatidate cytidylyltransferase [Planctomycetota bacterium]